MSSRPAWNIQRTSFIATLLVLTVATTAAFAQKADTKDTRSSSKAQSTKIVSKAANPARYETIRISKPDGSVVTLRVPRSRLLSRVAKPPVYRLTQDDAQRPAEAPAALPVTRLHSPRGAAIGATISHPVLGRQPLTITDTFAKTLFLTNTPARLGDNAAVAGDDPTEWRAGRGWAPGSEKEDGGDYLSDSTEFAILEPGSGWSGSTDEPPAVGDDTMPGWDAKAIARWDVVPYQTITEDFEIGVVAFHINGIDRVEFSANSGPWISVYEAKLNPRTQVIEYTAIIKPALFDSDGPIEIRAIAYPANAGHPRVLAGEFDFLRSYQGSEWTGEHSLFLTVNGFGTLDEQVVELPPGEYTWGVAPLYFGTQDDPSRWLTYRPTPGTDPSDVIIVGSSDFVPKQRNFKKIRLQNLTLRDANLAWFNNEPDKIIWYDGVTVPGTGQWTHNTVFPIINHQYWTNSAVHDMRSGQAKHFIRNSLFYNIGEDVIREGYLVLNTTIDNIDSGDTAWHSGVIANQLLHDNRIYYGVSITNLGNSRAWPMRNGTHEYWQNYDIAVIECNTSAIFPNETHAWYVGADTRHLLVDSSTFVGKFQWRTADGIPEYWRFKAQNVLITRTVLNNDPSNRPMPHPIDGVTFIESPK